MNFNKVNKVLQSDNTSSPNNKNGDFLVSDEKYRDMFLKISADVRKKINLNNMKFEKEFSKNDEFHKIENIEFTSNRNNHLINPNNDKSNITIQNEINQTKNKNSNFVFDYYSKFKNTENNNEYFTENLNLSKIQKNASINNQNGIPNSKVKRKTNELDKINNNFNDNNKNEINYNKQTPFVENKSISNINQNNTNVFHSNEVNKIESRKNYEENLFLMKEKKIRENDLIFNKNFQNNTKNNYGDGKNINFHNNFQNDLPQKIKISLEKNENVEIFDEKDYIDKCKELIKLNNFNNIDDNNSLNFMKKENSEYKSCELNKDEENYENFTQEYFLERYKQFIPSNYMTPSSFNKNITQLIERGKIQKSDVSLGNNNKNKIINIKCESQKNSNYEIEKKTKNQNNLINIDNMKKYLFSEDETSLKSKYDFSKLAYELDETANYSKFSPFQNIDSENNFAGNKNNLKFSNFSYDKENKFGKNMSFFKWVITYNKMLYNENFIRENNLSNFKLINPDIILEIVENNSYQKERFEILQILIKFFNNFSLLNLRNSNKYLIVLEISNVKFIDSLKILEVNDFLGEFKELAFIIPLDYYDYTNSQNFLMSNNNGNKMVKRKDIYIGDIIILKNLISNFCISNKEIYFIEEKDFEIINNYK